MARISIIGPSGRQERQLFRHNSLGRHPRNTHQVLDRVVSKEHCHIELVDDAYVLKDLGSLNGTYINGERVDGQRSLEPGDEITIGSTRIIFDPVEQASSLSFDALMSDEPREATNRFKIGDTSAGPLIRAKVSVLADKTFFAEELVQDDASLRRDYEKLRASYEVTRAIELGTSITALCSKILEVAFRLVPADRGVVLLHNEQNVLEPVSVRSAEDADPNQEVVVSKTVLDTVVREKQAVLSHDASADARFQSAQSVIMQGIRSTMCVPLLQGETVLGVMMLDSKLTTHAFTEKDLALFETVASQAAIAVQNTLFAKRIEQEAVMRERFRRLLSPAIAEQVLSGQLEVTKGGELRETTVLFADIRGFTSMSESHEPRIVVDALNEYFERMVEIVFRYEGTLDKFIGDEMMVLFGSPVAHDDDPDRAVRAALEMQNTLSELNARHEVQDLPPFEIGIGINTGEVVAGYIGSSQALEYTVIGDPVNTGARLCSLAKPGQTLLSQGTIEKLTGSFAFEELPEEKVKGKAKPIRVFEVIGCADPE
ncbi:MAG: GAF domain-containing protein [Deltaproteobacteria bacterium]|nr:GAF domain-containing protein [Deltaproteobacteria bacterium]NND29401.1 GAF domain-containing protein [Myxococcales bacterium]MBT8465097.1 GAF domain-containing protein [Deltaproteobacteria bacterium]MBT8483213.1 GAF domain-containing protein [Deltaproteobacteria bacterium]NNK07729.1 GAF domain-containing protein [Myxococcales bacterium]